VTAMRTRQGSLFLVCALAVITASLILPRIGRSAELMAVASAVLLLGVPHGALDPLFVRRLPGANSIGGWAAFGVGYAALAAAVVGLWATGLVPMLLVLCLVAAVWSRLGNVPVENRLVRIMFIGLAALTVAHMVLVERVRLSGWNNRNDGRAAPNT